MPTEYKSQNCCTDRFQHSLLYFISNHQLSVMFFAKTAQRMIMQDADKIFYTMAKDVCVIFLNDITCECTKQYDNTYIHLNIISI